MFTVFLIFALVFVAAAVIADRFVENPMGRKRFYVKDNDPYKGMSFSEQAEAEIDEILKANAKDWEELISQPSTENKNGVYRDPRHYEKTGERQYRVNEMRYDNHTVFRAEYLIPGDDRWYTFNELQTLEALHGSKYTTWMPIDFKTLEEAKKCCEDDKKVFRNETLLETIEHTV